MNEGDPDVLEWTQIWRTNDGQGERDTFVSDSLPRFASVRSELRSCSIDHLGNEEIDLALSRHSMRSVLTACRSERYQMSDSDEVCMCRYKVNTCCAGRTTVVHQQGWPLMSDPAAESPPHPHLTLPMRELLSSSLTSNPTASSYRCMALSATASRWTTWMDLPRLDRRLRTILRTGDVATLPTLPSKYGSSLFAAVSMHPTSPRDAVFFSDSLDVTTAASPGWALVPRPTRFVLTFPASRCCTTISRCKAT